MGWSGYVVVEVSDSKTRNDRGSRKKVVCTVCVRVFCVVRGFAWGDVAASYSSLLCLFYVFSISHRRC